MLISVWVSVFQFGGCYRQMGEEVKGSVVVPESVLKKQKRAEEWALAKAKELEVAKKKKDETRKLICQKARQYTKEYEEQVLLE